MSARKFETYTREGNSIGRLQSSRRTRGQQRHEIPHDNQPAKRAGEQFEASCNVFDQFGRDVAQDQQMEVL